MYEQFLINLWLWSPFTLIPGAIVGATLLLGGLVFMDKAIWTMPGGLVLLVALVLGIYAGEAPKRLAAMAQTPTSNIDLEGTVRCDGNPICSNRVLLIDETGDRTELFLRTSGGYTLMDGDQVSLSGLGTPTYAFTFPALCQNNKCWLVSNRDRESAVCRASETHICMSGRELRALWGGMSNPGFPGSPATNAVSQLD